MANKTNIIGTFTGECADADVTNENGIDIPREVWETVFASDIYKQGIELGWYIGFAGHPEDVGCMDFKNACIVMTEGHIDDDGKVYGTFNLLDTPVGRVIKTMIDAGVTFGISVRGAGDVYNNTVDPETFVFRGFDLVTFPAYKEAIPQFTEIAASTDTKQRAKYQSICNSVNKELKEITSCEAIDVIKSAFPEQSDTFKDLETRESKLKDLSENDVSDECKLNEDRVNGLLSLYLDMLKTLNEKEKELEERKKRFDNISLECSKKESVLHRIVTDQNNSVKELKAAYDTSSAFLKRRNKILCASNKRMKETIEANSNIEVKFEGLERDNKKLQSKIEASQNVISSLKRDNLQYSQKIEASDRSIREKDEAIDRLKSQIDKTVVNADTQVEKISNLEARNKKLLSQVEASTKLIEEYQDAYAEMYSQALGVGLNNVTVNASTGVDELKKIISKSSNICASQEIDEAQPVLDGLDDSFESDNLVTV